jgi:predicted Zn-ribbon and HTH transcriptional regulator
MPDIYRIYCNDCDKTADSEFPKGVGGYVGSKEKPRGKLMANHYLELVLDDKTVVLPHPVEFSVLNSNNYTWRKAAAEARLVRVTPALCRKCGTANENRKLDSLATGCLYSVILMIGYGISLKLSKQSFLSHIITAAIPVILLEVVRRIVFGIKYRKRLEILKPKPCSLCGSLDFVTLENALKQTFPCPTCGKNSLRCQIAGRS